MRTWIDKFLLILILALPAWAVNNFATDPNVVSVFNAETWDTYLDDQVGTNHLESTPQVRTADVREGDGCMEIDPTTRQSGIDYDDGDLGAGWPGKNGTLNKTISITMWFKPHQTWSALMFGTLLFKAGDGWGLFLYNAKVYWFIGDSLFLDWKATTATFVADQWYHVGVTFDNSDKSYLIRLYDLEAATASDKGGNFTDNMTVSTGDVSFGYGGVRTLGYNYDGLIDDVAVFNDVLTADEIDNCRAGTYDYASDAACVAHWSFDTATFMTEDKGSLAWHEASIPNLDTTVFKIGTASLEFQDTDYEPGYRLDTNLSADTPYKNGTTNLEFATTFWFRARSLYGRHGLVSKYINSSSGSVGVECSAVAGTYYVQLNVRYAAALKNTYVHSTAIAIDTWYFVAVNVSALNDTYSITVWNDTTQTQVKVSGALSNDPIVSTKSLIIGGLQETSTPSDIDGWLDEIVIYNDNLTDDEIGCIRMGNYPACGGSQVIPMVKLKR